MARGSVLLLFVVLGACTGFRAVSDGVYRSGQPGEDQLARRIAQHDLRTVVCLRSRNEASGGSARAAEGAGIQFWNIPMSARSAPAPETLLALWQVAAAAPRPLLLHCRAGVDRTGLASALVVLHDTGDLDRARAELALLPHGHVGLFGTEAMDEVLEDYAPHHGQRSFPDWVTQVYAPAQAAQQ